MQILFETPEPRYVTINPIPEQRRTDEPEDVDEGSLHRTEDRAVHDGEGVGHGKRRRRDDHEYCDRKRVR